MFDIGIPQWDSIIKKLSSPIRWWCLYFSEEREKMKVNKLEISRLDQGYLVIVTYYNGALDKGRYAFNTLAGMLDFVLPLLNKCDEKY